ncbi:MAG: hypothetical protein ABWY92_02670 [Xanthobacteraceae bacterium]|jgi:hypothetical protein
MARQEEHTAVGKNEKQSPFNGEAHADANVSHGSCAALPVLVRQHLDRRLARELRTLGDELEAKAREAQTAADAAAPPIVQAYAPR